MGIYRKGAGLGPALAFLCSGRAINVLAIIMTARVLGWKVGLARAIGAVVFSILIGLLMALILRGEEAERRKGPASASGDGDADRTLELKKTAVFVSLVVVVATISGMIFGVVIA